MNKSSRIIEKIKSVFPDETINELSKESGFVQRIRKIKPVYFLWSLVLGFSFGNERNISNFRRVYERISGQQLVPSAFYDRFNQGLVTFLQKLLLMSLDTLKTAWFELDFRLQAFEDILYTDSTIIKLQDKLAKVFPGARTNHSPASAKLHALFSVTGKGKSTIQLSAGRVHDKKKFTIGSWCKNRLMLFDLGYYSFALFRNIDRYKGYFISRLKENANPVIMDVKNSPRGKSDPLVGKPLKDVLLTLRRDVLDVEVVLQFKNRKYNGRRNKSSKSFRLVAIRDHETKSYHCYITNVPNDFLTPQEIANCYRCRWEIELVFKELKSGYRLDQITSGRPEIVKAMLYAAILTFIVSRRLLELISSFMSKELAERITAGRWWRLFSSYAQELLLVIVRPRHEVKVITRDLIKTIIHELVDPHTKRRPMFKKLGGYSNA